MVHKVQLKSREDYLHLLERLGTPNKVYRYTETYWNTPDVSLEARISTRSYRHSPEISLHCKQRKVHHGQYVHHIQEVKSPFLNLLDLEIDLDSTKVKSRALISLGSLMVTRNLYTQGESTIKLNFIGSTTGKIKYSVYFKEKPSAELLEGISTVPLVDNIELLKANPKC